MLAPDRLMVSSLFRSLSATDRLQLAALLEERTLQLGETLVRQDDVDRDLYILLEGELRVSRHGHDLGPLPAGAFVGEISLLNGRRRSASVHASSRAVVARLRHASWVALSRDHPGLALGVAEALAATLADQLLAMTDSAALLFDGRTLPKSAHPNIEVVTGAETRALTVHAGTTVDAVLPSSVDGAAVVSALLGRRAVALGTPILADCRITAVTLASWEGREVWRRSAGLLFLAAAHNAVPAARFQLLHSVGAARVVRCSADARDAAQAIEAQMARLVESDLPLSREQWTVEEARTHFERHGAASAAHLLSTSRTPTVVLSGLDGTYAHAMGPALPSTGALRGVRLRAHPEGLLLDYQEALGRWVDGAAEAVALEGTAPRFGSPMRVEHEHWLASMGVDSVGAFNELCINGKVRDVIRVAEGFHEKHIGHMADRIAQQSALQGKDGVRIIAIAGPSSSGKTTFIKRLSVQLEVNGLHPISLSLDDYYVDRDKCPRDPAGDYDFEHIDALDLRLLQQHIRRLLDGQRVRIARFDFKSGRSWPEGGEELQLSPQDILIIEGIHGMNPALLADAVAPSELFRLFVQPALCLPFDDLSALSPSDVRFLRRIVRDRHARGSKAQDNILRWSSVRRGEGRHIFPHKGNADAVFDTSLAYEMSVLKVYGERYLLEVPPEHPAFSTAYRLRQLLDRFVAIYPEHVPPTSLLREFIGGSGFEY